MVHQQSQIWCEVSQSYHIHHYEFPSPWSCRYRDECISCSYRRAKTWPYWAIGGYNLSYPRMFPTSYLYNCKIYLWGLSRVGTKGSTCRLQRIRGDRWNGWYKDERCSVPGVIEAAAKHKLKVSMRSWVGAAPLWRSQGHLNSVQLLLLQFSDCLHQKNELFLASLNPLKHSSC